METACIVVENKTKQEAIGSTGVIATVAAPKTGANGRAIVFGSGVGAASLM